MTIARREFLTTGAGLLLVSVVTRVSPSAAALEPAADETGTVPSRNTLAPELLDSWLTVDADGKVTVYTGRIDMGTGVETAFAQILADELEVRYESVSIIMGDTGLTPDQGKSTSSSNLSRGLRPLRTAAAEAREVFVGLAAERLHVPVEDLVAREGVVHVAEDPARQITYGALLQGRRFERQLKVTDPTIPNLGFETPQSDGGGPLLEGTAKFKASDFRYVGKSIPRRDVPAKVTGTYEYVHNVRVPGMLHARVVRPPTIGATLLSVNETSVRDIPSLIQVVRINNFLGVVTEREEDAVSAARQLKATWQPSSVVMPTSETVSAWLKAAKPIRSATRNRGDVDAAFAKAAKVLRATYEYPCQNHGMIGPSCAVADVQADRITIWSGSQWIQQTRRDIARFLNVPVEKVRVIWKLAAGSYGRLGVDDAAADAALLSRAVGRPVRVQWMRQDEHAWEPKSPPMVIDVRAAIDETGGVLAYDQETWSQSHPTAEVGNFVAWRLVGGNPGWARLFGAEGGTQYTFPSTRSTGHYVDEVLRSIYLRAPGGIQNAFAAESFVDELAANAKMDAIEFRLRHTQNDRAARILRAAAEKAGWQKRVSGTTPRPSSGLVSGRGVAGEGRASVVVNVEVDLDTGTVRVPRAVIVAWAGRIVNPDGMRHQCQGAFLQGLSRSLFEEVKFEGGRVTTVDWRSYPIMRLPDVPIVETVLINQDEVEFSGVGELATGPVAAAVGNAVFDATGVRIRRVPFTPARVREALVHAN